MASNYASTSTASSSMSTSSASTTSKDDHQLTTAGIVLGIIGLLLIAGVILAIMRMKFPRGRSFTNLDDPESFTPQPRRRKLDFHHPATHITPYGSHVGEALRFQHTPGSDMRIATRRPDGAWQFSDPSSPFTPSGVSELDSSPKRSYKSSLPKKTKSTLFRDTQFDYGGHYDFVIDPPPPAYGYDYSGHFPPQKN